MNLYHAVFPEKKLFRKHSQKSGFRGISYLSFMVRDMTKNIIIQNLD